MSMLCTLMRRILSRCVCESQSKLRQSYLGHRFWSFPLSCGEEVALETFRSNREPLRSSLKSPDVCLTAIQEPGVSPLVSVQHSRHWAERSCCVLSYGKTGKTCRGEKKEEYLRFKSCHQEPTELFYLTYSMFCLLFPALFLKKKRSSSMTAWICHLHSAGRTLSHSKWGNWLYLAYLFPADNVSRLLHGVSCWLFSLDFIPIFQWLSCLYLYYWTLWLELFLSSAGSSKDINDWLPGNRVKTIQSLQRMTFDPPSDSWGVIFYNPRPSFYTMALC